MRIGIEKNDDTIPHRGQTALQRARFPAIFLTQQPHPWIGRRDCFHLGRRLVARSVVDHNYLDLSRVIGGENGAQSFRDHFFFIVCGHQHTERFGEIRWPSPAETRGQPDHGECSQHHERSRDNHEGPEKFFRCVENPEAGAGDKMIQAFGLYRRH